MAIETYELPLKEIVPIEEGGTGANSVEQARINLGIEDSVPVGTIISYVGNDVPKGFLDCSGAALNPVTYDKLFGVIGTSFGGDGYSSFNLPNLNNGSFLEGSNTAGTVKSAGLPNVTGNFTAGGYVTGNTSYMNGIVRNVAGAFYSIESHPVLKINSLGADSGSSVTHVGLDASRLNVVFGNSDTVQPKSVTVKFCIKY